MPSLVHCVGCGFRTADPRAFLDHFSEEHASRIRHPAYSGPELLLEGDLDPLPPEQLPYGLSRGTGRSGDLWWFLVGVMLPPAFAVGAFLTLTNWAFRRHASR